MNAFSILGLCLVALQGGAQDTGLTQPPSDPQSRKPAAETTVAILDVRDIVQKRLPATKPRTDRDLSVEKYLRDQDEAHERSWNGEKIQVNEATKGIPVAGKDASSAQPDVPSPTLVATRELAEFARRYMKPEFEPDQEQLSVPSEATLLATLRPEQHKWLRDFLDVQRRSTSLVEISFNVFEGKRGVFREVGLTSSSTVIEDPAELAALRAKLAERKIDSITAPRIAALNGQKAEISVLDQVAYVEDWKLRIVEPGPQEIAEPTINVAQDGFVASMCATALDDHTYGLDLSFVSSKLERPMQTRKIRLSTTNDREVEIGIPVVTKISFDSSLVLTDGASVAFTTASPQPDKDMAILVTMKQRSL